MTAPHRLGAALLALVPTLSLFAQDFPKYGDELYRPTLRQPGKDVMWLPTPDVMATRMLQAAKTTDKDLVYDLGAGDGKIPIAAAREFGAKAVGIEYDPRLAALAKRNAERAGVADKVTIIQGDIFREDFSKATVVTLYLLPELNEQLRPQLLRMKPGTRVVSHQWPMGEWEPDEIIRVDQTEAYLWIVPADVAGRWSLRDGQGSIDAMVELEQQFQRIGGSITMRGKTQPLVGAFVNGAAIGFSFVAPDGGVRSVRATIDRDRLSGTIGLAGTTTPVTGARR